MCVVLCCVGNYFLLFPVPYQIRQRVHQILNMRGSSIKIVRHILKGELRCSSACLLCRGSLAIPWWDQPSHGALRDFMGVSSRGWAVLRCGQGWCHRVRATRDCIRTLLLCVVTEQHSAGCCHQLSLPGTRCRHER